MVRLLAFASALFTVSAAFAESRAIPCPSSAAEWSSLRDRISGEVGLRTFGKLFRRCERTDATRTLFQDNPGLRECLARAGEIPEDYDELGVIGGKERMRPESPPEAKRIPPDLYDRKFQDLVAANDY
ncbi:MAG TPA: hypothetical protein VM598_00255, partial [Bdellovibrionota bacterium]|nr:hypothetical protein [Bdellovibrionota bacterium]